MNVYFATVDTYENETVMSTPYRCILCSYHYFQDNKLTFQLGKLMKEREEDPEFSVFMDSGAFSADSQGVAISVNEYSKYLKRLKPHLYAGLDVIGDAEATKKNQLKMEEMWELSPVPTFHMREDMKYLHEMLEKYEYIALGGMVFSKGTKGWLDEVWPHILKAGNKKVHGFGLTDQDLVKRYPWHSIDSSSFKSSKRFGRIVLLDENTMKLSSIRTADFIEDYIEKTGDKKIRSDYKRLWRLTDATSVIAYGKFVDHVTELHKKKDFGYLIQQGKLF